MQRKANWVKVLLDQMLQPECFFGSKKIVKSKGNLVDKTFNF
jgi:hypothetical protein